MTGYDRSAEQTDNSTQAYEHYNSDGTRKKTKGGKKGRFGLKFMAAFIAVAALIVLADSMVVTKQDQFKLVRQFGRVQRIVTEAGLSFKLPFIESVDTIPKNLL